jgi:hypothetical protein
VTRPTDLPSDRAKRLAELECPDFETRPWVTDPALSIPPPALSSAAWGAFVLVFACPSDDPHYIAVWYTVGYSIVMIGGRAVLLRPPRW